MSSSQRPDKIKLLQHSRWLKHLGNHSWEYATGITTFFSSLANAFGSDSPGLGARFRVTRG